MQRTVVLASNNAGKLAEFSSLLAPLGLALRKQSDLGISEAEEPYATFLENALAKARYVALGGAPGVLSARFAGEPKSDARNNQKLIQDLSANEDKSAYYYCVLVYLRHAQDPQPVIAEGRWDGEIIATPRGANGFGYDPHFWIASLNKTAAELSAEEKNQLSHRGQALRSLIAKWR